MPGKIKGTVVSIAADGSLVTDITAEQLSDAPRGESVAIRCGGHETVGIFAPDHTEPECTFLAVLPSGGTLQLCIVGVSAHAMLRIRKGEQVVVQW